MANVEEPDRNEMANTVESTLERAARDRRADLLLLHRQIEQATPEVSFDQLNDAVVTSKHFTRIEETLKTSPASVPYVVNTLAQTNQELKRTNQELERTNQKLERTSQELQEARNRLGLSPSLEGRKKKQFLVLGPSAVSKDPQLRQKFRENQVAEEHCRGGFIAQEFYLDFVRAAREFEGHTLPNELKTSIVSAVSNLGSILEKSARANHSLFNNGFLDEEAPQSAVGSELFRLAIDELRQNLDHLNHDSRLNVTHQQHLVTDIQMKGDSDPGFAIIRKKKRTRDDTTVLPPKKPEEEKKALDQIDICAWFIHPETSLGACVLAACEYKPGNIDQKEREAQADMYGSNILILHKKQCIVIDIAGANNLGDWNVSAYGLVEAKFTNNPWSWEKTPLYSGKGAEAIVLVSYGLLKAMHNFPRELDNYGTRLGPVVGVIDDCVYKAYDNAKFRKPNLVVVKELLDKNAELLSSKDKKLHIIKMELMESDWKKEGLSAKAFESIIKKLKKLHQKYGPHGDIRLANLLSSGLIVDFDFVGADYYPSTLQKLDQDGKRHPEVEGMIEKAETNDLIKLKPTTTHDWYSLAHVMRLFVPQEDAHMNQWVKLCDDVEAKSDSNDEAKSDSNDEAKSDSNDEAKSDSNDFPDFFIQLRNRDIPLQGIGHTPVKKQPTRQKTKKARLGQRQLARTCPF